MSAELDNLIRWALKATCPSSRQIGTHAVGRVLAALALHGNDRGEAWPSAQTLADGIDGLSRRDVRNALELLEEAGLIAKTGRRKGRCTVWRLAVDDTAGEVAGEVAGNVAGYPASKGREGKPPPARDPRMAELAALLEAEGVGVDEVEAVIEKARRDPQTRAPVGRLLASEPYRRSCVGQVHADAETERYLAEARKTAHAFVPDGSGQSCDREGCGLPENNPRHAVDDQRERKAS